jgi:hypothetical protein
VRACCVRKMHIYIFRVMIDWHHSLIRWHHSPDTLTPASQIRKESCKKFCYLTCSLYSQRANHMICKKVSKFIKLIKRFRILQGWLKTSDIWRDYQIWKKSFLKLFQKFKILMFLGERTLKKINRLRVSELLHSLTLSLLIFLVFARWGTSKFEKLQKALLSDLIINVKYRSFWVILAKIKSAWSA